MKPTDRQTLAEQIRSLPCQQIEHYYSGASDCAIADSNFQAGWMHALSAAARQVEASEGEAKPITQDFIRLHGGEGLHADDPYFGWGDDVGWVLAWYEPGNVLSIYGHDILHDHEPTQADVLSLLQSLKIAGART